MLPLQDRRILITRPAGQSSRLAQLLQARGATPILIPTIELAPPISYCALDAALTTLLTFDLLLFTSANAVQAFAARARHLGLPPRARSIAAIGPATAEAIREQGIEGPLLPLPAVSTAEGLLELLLPEAPGKSVLLVRAAQARDLLPEALAAAGATLTFAEAYRTILPPDSASRLDQAFADCLDAITFTSASTAQNLVSLLATANLTFPLGVVLASIGPITSQAMRDLNLIPTLEAEEATIAALTSAMEAHFSPTG